ncbi:Uncharacterised protein [Bordetella pertussis]|nr:Uncharacterised protein [Bordetella pertussis]
MAPNSRKAQPCQGGAAAPASGDSNCQPAAVSPPSAGASTMA